MKRFLRSIWPEGYIFLFFCALFILGTWLFLKLVFASLHTGSAGGGMVVGAIWAWFMGKISNTVTDSGKEWIEALKAKAESAPEIQEWEKK